MRRTLALAAVATAVLAFAAPADAKPFTYTDPKGDMPVAGVDITAVTYATTGTTTSRRVGTRVVKTYTPTHLVVTMALADKPVEQPGVRFKVEAQVQGCGVAAFSYAPGTVYAGLVGPATLFLGCGGSDELSGYSQILMPKLAVSGNRLVWTLAIKALPKNVRVGATFTDLNASIDLVEPVLGVQGSEETGGPALVDAAATKATWKLG